MSGYYGNSVVLEQVASMQSRTIVRVVPLPPGNVTNSATDLIFVSATKKTKLRKRANPERRRRRKKKSCRGNNTFCSVVYINKAPVITSVFCQVKPSSKEPKQALLWYEQVALGPEATGARRKLPEKS